jgi:hypothetical protein
MGIHKLFDLIVESRPGAEFIALYNASLVVGQSGFKSRRKYFCFKKCTRLLVAMYIFTTLALYLTIVGLALGLRVL